MIQEAPINETTLYAATGDAVVRVFSSDGKLWEASASLEDKGAQCVAVDPKDRDRVFAGTFDDGLWRSLDGGDSWQRIEVGIEEDRVLSVAISPSSVTDGLGAVYAGTEPSRLYISEDDGETWRSCPTLLELPSAPTWSFPPRPWTSHVRWIALHHQDPEIIYAGIELGGVMRSTDGGLTWEDRKPGSQPDSHVVLTHSRDPGRVYEAAGGGVALSVDAGETWTPADEGMGLHYVWGLAVDPEDPGLWYVSAAPGPGQAHASGRAGAHLYRKEGDAPWRRLGGNGLSDVFDDMPYALVSPRADELVVGFRSGRIAYSTDRGESWAMLDVELPGIVSMAR